MDIRNKWISDPATPGRVAEVMARSIFALILYLATLYALLVWAGATIEWFAAFGLLVPLFWLLDWIIPTKSCSRP